MTDMKPLTYHEQFNYYIALCDSASELAGSWSDYRWMIAQIRKELRADPAYKELVEKKFRAPERAAAEAKQDENLDLETLEAALDFPS